MQRVEEYESWFLPALLNDEAYRELVKAFLEEIVYLQKTNMGSYDDVGFNGVEEDVDFDSVNDWAICSAFNPYTGAYTIVADGFSLASSELVYAQVVGDRFAVVNYPYVTGESYLVEFTLYDIQNYASDMVLSFGLGFIDQSSVTIDIGTTEVQVSVELEAVDHWLYFGVASGGADFKVKDFSVTGVESSANEDIRWLNLRRLTDIDNAGRFVLERMRDSLSFPSIANTPEELLKQLIKDYNEFISYKGSELLSTIFFYFLGYAVDFTYLYAQIGDYEGRSSSYVQQKEDDLLVSSLLGTVYGQCALTASFTKVIQMESTLQVVVGDKLSKQDKLSNQDNAFPNTFVTVTRVEGNLVYVDDAVDVYIGDLFDIYRKYTYSVNPDPSTLFKTSHLDVFFIEKYIEGTGIDFDNLQEAFESYLPINVVIRFFGFTQDIDDEFFKVVESLFSFKLDQSDDFEVEETSTTFPADDFVYLFADGTPETHKGINGESINADSAVILEYDVNGDPVYVGYYI